MTTPCRILSFLALALVVLLPASASATPYNPFTDFSPASNPNGVWSYGYGSVGSGPVTLYTKISAQSWVYSTSGATEPILGATDGIYGGVNAPAGDLILHPGDADNLASILVFTAPTSGTYTLSGLFERDNTSVFGNGVKVFICQDTTNCSLFSSLVSSSHYLNNATFNLSRTLTAGETLDFEVARNGSYVYDTTGLQLNISNTTNVAATPEPSSLVLLASGIVGICGSSARRWRRRATR